jgi:hypothetical protein
MRTTKATPAPPVAFTVRTDETLLGLIDKARAREEVAVGYSVSRSEYVERLLRQALGAAPRVRPGFENGHRRRNP